VTLRNDNPQRKRPPMKNSTMWIWIGSAAAVLIFAVVVVIVSGQSFF